MMQEEPDRQDHPALVEARGIIAVAADKMRALNDAGLRLAPLIGSGTINKADAVDCLGNSATAYGLCTTPRDRETVEHIIGMALGGMSAIADISEAAPKTGALVSQCAADIAPEAIEWIWPSRIARGKHTCIAGEPGTGKSQLSIDIIARVTTGESWPCDEGRATLGSVVILSAEDGAADTIVPRLLAAGADLNRVHIVTAVHAESGHRAFNLQHDLSLLEQKIATIGDVVLVVIDPVSSYLGKTDSHKNSEVRGVLEPLGEMAERMRVAILSITHFAKSGAGNTTKALHRFIGSIAFTGAPRAAFAVIEDADHDGRRLFLSAKSNLARPPGGLAFHLEQFFVRDDIMASRVIWSAEPVTITANEAMAADAAGTESRTAKAEAAEFLRAVLTSGPVPAAEVNRMAREHGLTVKAIRSAREALRVKIERDGFGPGSRSLWSLPEGA